MDETKDKAAMVAQQLDESKPVKKSSIIYTDWTRQRQRIWLNTCLSDMGKRPEEHLVALGFCNPDGAKKMAEGWSNDQWVIQRKEAFLAVFEKQSLHTRDSALQEAWNFFHSCKDEFVKRDLMKILMEVHGVVTKDDGGAAGTLNLLAVQIQNIKEAKSGG